MVSIAGSVTSNCSYGIYSAVVVLCNHTLLLYFIARNVWTRYLDSGGVDRLKKS